MSVVPLHHPNAPRERNATPTPQRDMLAEQAVDAQGWLAGILLAGAAREVLDVVRLEWISATNLRRYFQAAKDLLDRGEDVDLVSITQGLGKDAMIKACELLETAYGPANIVPLAGLVEREWKRQRAKELGAQLIGDDATPERRAAIAVELAGLEHSAINPRRMAESSMTGEQLVAADLPPLASLLGDGILVAGGSALIIGHSGLGKTFLAIQTMQALCSGSMWLESIGTVQGGCVCGLLELEMPASSIKRRLLCLPGEWRSRAHFQCMPRFAVDIATRDTQDELIGWIRDTGMAVLIIDPFGKVHGLDENHAADMGLVGRALERVRAETGVAIILIHHANKSSDIKNSEGTPRTLVLQMARGSGKPGNDADTVLGLLEAPGARARLIFGKTRHCDTPSDFYLMRDRNGFLVRTEAIQVARSNKTAEKITRYLDLRGPSSPATILEIAGATNMSDESVRRHVRQMKNLITTQGKPTRYAISTNHNIDAVETVTDEAPYAW